MTRHPRPRPARLLRDPPRRPDPPKPFQPRHLRRPRRRDRRPRSRASATTESSSPWSSCRDGDAWQVLSGHRRLACAAASDSPRSPAGPRDSPGGRPPARGPGIQPPAPQDVQPDDARGRRPRRPCSPTPPAAAAANLRPVPRRRARRASEFRRSGTVAPTRASPPRSAWAARTSTARPAPSGASPTTATPAPSSGVAPARRRDQDDPRRL